MASLRAHVRSHLRLLCFALESRLKKPWQRWAAVSAVGAAVATLLELVHVDAFQVDMQLQVSALQVTLEGTSDLGQGELDSIVVLGVRELIVPEEITGRETTVRPPEGERSFSVSVQREANGAVALAPLRIEPGSELTAVSLSHQPAAFELSVAGAVSDPLSIVMRHLVTIRAPKMHLGKDVGAEMSELKATLSERFNVRGSYSAASVDLLGADSEISSLRFSVPHDPATEPRPRSSIMKGSHIELVDFGKSYPLEAGCLVRPTEPRGTLRLTATSDGTLNARFQGQVHGLRLGYSHSSLRDRAPSFLDLLAANHTLRQIVSAVTYVTSSLRQQFAK